MVFIQIRLTPSQVGEPEMFKHPRQWWPSMKDFLESYGTIEASAACFETKNKFGEDTHPHYHVNVQLDDHNKDFSKEYFQKWIRRQPYQAKGNKAYSVRVVPDPTEEDRWWRYILKENESIGAVIAQCFPQNFPEDFDLHLNTHLAVDERKLQIERNIKARAKALQTDNFRLRMFNKLNTNYLERGFSVAAPPPSQTIFCDLVQAYQDDNRIPPFNTMSNMVWDFKIHCKYLTALEYYNLKYPNGI